MQRRRHKRGVLRVVIFNDVANETIQDAIMRNDIWLGVATAAATVVYSRTGESLRTLYWHICAIVPALRYYPSSFKTVHVNFEEVKHPCVKNLNTTIRFFCSIAFLVFV